MIKRQTSLSRNVVQFCRFLRLKGFSLSVEEQATTLQAMEFIDYSNRDIFALALKSTCCKTRAQHDEFDVLFNEYWKEATRAIDSKIKARELPVLKSAAQAQSVKSLQSWLNGNRDDTTEESATYSIHENLSHKDFSAVPEEQTAELMRIIKALSVRLAVQINRGYINSGKNYLPDLRRTLRRNLRFGGELMEIAFKAPKRKRTKLVLLCDVSKSMDLYTAFMLQFMFAFQQVYARMETFVFSTSLQQITTLLKHASFKETLDLLSRQNNGWSGGTRIGESLEQFLKEYSARFLDKRSIVIILSDGWDTGNISLLEQSMKTIHDRSKKLIWLNPMAGYAFYQPDTAGMKAAMPFIDIFAPVHNVESLRKLGRWL